MQARAYLLLLCFCLIAFSSGYGMTQTVLKGDRLDGVALLAVGSRPVANPRSIVDGDVRFTVITPTLVRMEYSTDGQFINRRSYFAWERNVKPPQYAVTRMNGVLTITTSRMNLVWKGGANDSILRTCRLRSKTTTGIGRRGIRATSRPGTWEGHCIPWMDVVAQKNCLMGSYRVTAGSSTATRHSW